MKRIRRFFMFLAAVLVFGFNVGAQDVYKSVIASEILDYSISELAESLPQDLGQRIFEKVSLSEESCDYYYTFKDDVNFIVYKNSQPQVKSTLISAFKQSMSVMESTLLFCIDTDISLNYHYCSTTGDEIVISFSNEELKGLLGIESVTDSIRQEITARWLPQAFPAEEGAAVSYQGMTDSDIQFSLTVTDDEWENVKTDPAFMEGVARALFNSRESGRLFSLLCIYADKAEELIIVNAKTGAQKRGVISHDLLWEACFSSLIDNWFKSRNAGRPEVRPQFMNRNPEFFADWVNSRLRYPPQAIDNNITGSVVVRFTIETDGSVTNVHVVRSVDPLLDAEAVRVVSSSPNWKPGMKDDEPVKVTFTFPVVFSLKDRANR